MKAMERRIATWKLDPHMDYRPYAEFLRRLRQLPRHVWLPLMLLLGGAAGGLVIGLDRAWLGVPVYSLAVSLPLLFGFAYAERARPEVVALMADPCPLEQFPVNVSFVRGGYRYGEDRGW